MPSLYAGFKCFSNKLPSERDNTFLIFSPNISLPAIKKTGNMASFNLFVFNEPNFSAYQHDEDHYMYMIVSLVCKTQLTTL